MKLTAFEKHELEIAKATLAMPDSIAAIMGGMSKEEARQIVERLSEAKVKEDSEKI